MTVSAARSTALAVVTRVREQASFAHETLAAALGKASLSPQDASLATRIAYGTIACRGTLDDAVLRFVAHPAALEPRIADALALAAYELLYMRTPPWAAVDEGVDLVRSIRPRAAGLANAVLRRLTESRDSFPWGDPATDDAALARLTGHPEWLVRQMTTDLGRVRAGEFLAADNEPAPLFLAYLPFVGTWDEAVRSLESDGAEPIPCDLPGCLRAARPSRAVSGSAVSEGRVVVCDAAAQFAARAVRPRAGARIAEIGAGRGTKTLLMQGIALANGAPADILAVDSHAFKLEVLAAAIDRFDVPNVSRHLADAAEPLDRIAEPASCDTVLVDAPCSGLGTLRRHPDKRWRIAPNEIESLATLGIRILEQASRLVRPGGFVVYSTCTVTRAENDDVVAAFLDGPYGEGFTGDDLTNDTPDSWRRFVRGDGTFQSLPEPDGPDGHFVARLRRA